MVSTSSSFMSLPCMVPTNCEHLRRRGSFSTLRSRKPAVKCSMESNTPPSRQPNTANQFHSNAREAHVISSSSSTTHLKPHASRLVELKMEVKNALSLAADDPHQQLDLVDKIQRLGVAYHFEAEIKDILERSYNSDYANFWDQNVSFDDGADLYHTSLRFRLLRQAGYYVSPAVFNKFKDGKGEFHEGLKSDVPGMLSLYEASYVSFNGEDIMDKVMAFTTEHLHSMVMHLNSSLALQVQRTQNIPHHRSPEREQAIHYISIYQYDKSHNEALLEFAKLDYNDLQLLHREELGEISRWWKHNNFMSKLPFDFRDRVVESFAFAISFNFERQFSLGRIHLAKIWYILTIVDDGYEWCSNLDELQQVTEAFQRWDVGDSNELPDYMKFVLVVLDFYNEIKAEMVTRGNYVGIPYLKKMFQSHTKALYDEAKVNILKEIPTFERCLQLSAATIAFNVFLVTAVMNMEELATNEIFNWIVGMPKIIKCSYLIPRLVDDIADYKVEKDRGILFSCVACYMNDYGVSESKANERLQMMITYLWKDLNQESLRVNNPLPIPVIKFIINFARNMMLYYSDGDGYTNPKGRTEKIIASLLINPIPM